MKKKEYTPKNVCVCVCVCLTWYACKQPTLLFLCVKRILGFFSYIYLFLRLYWHLVATLVLHALHFKHICC